MKANTIINTIAGLILFYAIGMILALLLSAIYQGGEAGMVIFAVPFIFIIFTIPLALLAFGIYKRFRLAWILTIAICAYSAWQNISSLLSNTVYFNAYIYRQTIEDFVWMILMFFAIYAIKLVANIFIIWSLAFNQSVREQFFKKSTDSQINNYS